MFETTDMEGAIEDIVKGYLRELNTFMPAEVIAYDAEKQLVDVQPALKTNLYTPPSSVPKPQLTNIPVIYPRSGGGFIHIPIKAGDQIGVIFSQSSITNWKAEGGLSEVDSIRLHDFNDAVAIVGLDIEANAKTLPDPDKMCVASSEGLWVGNPDGAGAPAASVNESELFQALEALTKALYEVPLVSSMGPVNFDPTVVAKFQALEALFKEIGGN